MILSNVMSWVLLAFCAVIEVVWALSLKYTEGFTRLWPTILCVGVSTFNIFLLSVVFRTLPTNVGYAIWVAAGIVGTAIGSYFIYSEKLSIVQLGFIALIVVGIVGLKLVKA